MKERIYMYIMNGIESTLVSNRGLIRKNNEDNFYLNNTILESDHSPDYVDSYVSNKTSHIFAICDGMGGQEKGEIASSEVVLALKKYYTNYKFKTNTIQEKMFFLNKFIMKVNDYIYRLSIQKGFDRMGTTFVCLLIHENNAVIINVGDSRGYIFRNGKLLQLTEDHTESQRLVRLGLITKESARHHVGRSFLSKYLGSSQESGIMDGHVSDIISIQKDDIFLLCSDGLTDMLGDNEIENIFTNNDSLEIINKNLIDKSLKNGGRDNITIITTKIK